MYGRSKRATVALTTGDADLLAASASVNRQLRQLYFVNTTTADISVRVGLAASYSTATSLAHDLVIRANSVFPINFPGTLIANTAIRGFASAAGVTLTISYDEEVA